MPDVDLNQKVWGVKAQTHFYGFLMIYVTISFINLVAIIDLMALPPKVKGEYGSTGYFYLMDIPATMVCAFFLFLILFCMRIKTFYGIVGMALISHSSFVLLSTIINLLLPKPVIPLPSVFQSKVDKVNKYYKYSRIGTVITATFASVVKIYLGVVLLKLSFCAPRPVIYVDNRRRSRYDLEQRSGRGDEEEVEDVEEKPRSKKMEVEKNEKSGKSGNSKSGTGKSEKSLEKSKSGTGKSEKSGN